LKEKPLKDKNQSLKKIIGDLTIELKKQVQRIKKVQKIQEKNFFNLIA